MRSASGNIVDVVKGQVRSGTIHFDSKIRRIEYDDEKRKGYILPGLVDAHIHIESTMLTPSSFALAAAPHGTIATVSDPHEIANVLGMEGVRFMMDDAAKTPLKIRFAAPSCVPATGFETAGARLGPKEIAALMRERSVVALAEVMDYPAVIRRDKAIMAKIRAAIKAGKPVDGHCPLLTGRKLRRYIDAGISTEHECSRRDEAIEKAEAGMKIMIREGSCEKNLDELAPLARDHDYECFLVSDDKDARDLLKEGHVDHLLRRMVSKGVDPIKAVRMASLNPALHYDLDVGLLQEGDQADMVLVDDLRHFKVRQVWADGHRIAEDGKALFKARRSDAMRMMRLAKVKPADLEVRAKSRAAAQVLVIEAHEGQLVTGKRVERMETREGLIHADPAKDTLKIAVLERYGHGRIGLGFIRGFGFRRGAIASSIAHDSHNLVAVGASGEDMCAAIEEVRRMGGGLAVSDRGRIKASLPLPVAGLMSAGSAQDVARGLVKLEKEAKRMGGRMERPFMTLSFMALLVIPSLKLSDEGLFDSERFAFVPLVR